MKAEILTVGTEILLGDILNTNAQFLARELAKLGISMHHQSVVGDNPERLKKAYDSAFQRCELVITTGGLGPTKDDLTKEIAAKFFNKKLKLHEESLRKIEKYFSEINKPVNEGNKKQAYFPEDAVILCNDHGTAPGCIIRENEKILIMLPGPPREVVPMFKNYVIPFLEQFQNNVIVSRVIRICGIGEGQMEQAVMDIIDGQKNPTVAPYAKEGEVILRLTAKATNAEDARKLIEPVEERIRERLGENIYGVDDTSLEEVIGELLVSEKLTISTAESCTGGLLAGRIINYPGISSAYLEGAITYSNEAKIKRLKVRDETLDKYGAVSSQTAAEMAEGIAKSAGTDIGVSVTGIAGPSGGTLEKPVGLVYIGLYFNGVVKTRELRITLGDRQHIRNRTVTYTLDWIRREIIEHKRIK